MSIVCKVGILKLLDKNLVNHYSIDGLLALKNLVNVTQQVFQKVYLATLNNYTEFTLANFAKNDSCNDFLQKQLNLSINALKLCQGLLLPRGVASEVRARQEAKWVYAFFIVGLFYSLKTVDSKENMQKVIPLMVFNWLNQEEFLFKLLINFLDKNEQNIFANIFLKLDINMVEVDGREVNQTVDQKLPINILLELLKEKNIIFDQKNIFLILYIGLFVSIDLVNGLLLKNNIVRNLDEFIQVNRPYLLKNTKDYYFQYRPKNVDDWRIYTGIIIDVEVLDEYWRNEPLNNDFMPVTSL